MVLLLKSASLPRLNAVACTAVTALVAAMTLFFALVAVLPPPPTTPHHQQQRPTILLNALALADGAPAAAIPHNHHNHPVVARRRRRTRPSEASVPISLAPRPSARACGDIILNKTTSDDMIVDMSLVTTDSYLAARTEIIARVPCGGGNTSDAAQNDSVDEAEAARECSPQIVVVTDRCTPSLRNLAAASIANRLSLKILWADPWNRVSAELAYLRGQPHGRLIVLADPADLVLRHECSPDVITAKWTELSRRRMGAPVILSAAKDPYNGGHDDDNDDHVDDDDDDDTAREYHHVHPATMTGQVWALTDVLNHIRTDTLADPSLHRPSSSSSTRACDNPIHPHLHALTRAHRSGLSFLGNPSPSATPREIIDAYVPPSAHRHAVPHALRKSTAYLALDTTASLTLVLDSPRVVFRVPGFDAPCLAHHGGLRVGVSPAVARRIETVGFRGVRSWRGGGGGATSASYDYDDDDDDRPRSGLGWKLWGWVTVLVVIAVLFALSAFFGADAGSVEGAIALSFD